MEKFLGWLHEFKPAPVSIDGLERLRACCGALIGILLTGLVTHLLLGPSAAVPMLIAPMGASAVLLFCVPGSPLAQPWSIMGGNTVAAIIGVTCVKLIGDPTLAASMAIALSIGAMFLLRCLHPPSGAVALTAVLGGAAIEAQGYYFVLFPVGINSLLMLLVAILFNNAVNRRYPHSPQADRQTVHATKDLKPSQRVGFTPSDLDNVLKQYNQVLDVSRDDMEQLFMKAEMHAYRRRFGEITCSDIMSRDVVTVEFGTKLEEAWTMLRRHRIKALPVVDRARRVIGIVTLIDFMKHADMYDHDTFDSRFRHFLRRTFQTHSEKAEVIGQIMTSPVQTANTSTHIVELAPLLSDAGLHHVPIIDDERRLAGIVTQSDLVAALYRGRLMEVPITT